MKLVFNVEQSQSRPLPLPFLTLRQIFRDVLYASGTITSVLIDMSDPVASSHRSHLEELRDDFTRNYNELVRRALIAHQPVPAAFTIKLLMPVVTQKKEKISRHDLAERALVKLQQTSSSDPIRIPALLLQDPHFSTHRKALSTLIQENKTSRVTLNWGGKGVIPPGNVHALFNVFACSKVPVQVDVNLVDDANAALNAKILDTVIRQRSKLLLTNRISLWTNWVKPLFRGSQPAKQIRKFNRDKQPARPRSQLSQQLLTVGETESAPKLKK